MSVRTIIEINHDYIYKHAEAVEIFDWLLQYLRAGNNGATDEEFEPMIRILGQRHHSQPGWKQAEK